MTQAIWNSSNSVEAALSLPVGRLTCGLAIEISVSPELTEEAAQKLINIKWTGNATTQAKVIVEAQKSGAFTGYATFGIWG